jgi:hypothetical protein
MDIVSEWSYFEGGGTVALSGAVVVYLGPQRAIFPSSPEHVVVIESPAVGYGRWYGSMAPHVLVTPQIVEPYPNRAFLLGAVDDLTEIRFVTPAVFDLSRYPSFPPQHHVWPEWADVVPAPSDAASPRVQSPSGASAVDAFERLMQWLDLTTQEVEAVTAVARRTYFYWKQSHTKPRPNTVRQLWKIYTLMESVVRHLGVDGVRSWLRSGMNAPLDLLRQGNVEAFQRAVSDLLFGAARGTTSEPFVLRPDEDREPDVDVGPDVIPVKRAKRLVRRSPATGDR